MITSIPTDCLLEILPYLDESDLHEISCLSHRIFDIVKYQLKRTNSRRNGWLKIVESEYGLTFVLNYDGTDINYCYTLINCPWGGPPKSKRFTFSNQKKHEYEKFLLEERHFIAPQLNVNSEFLACLGTLLEQHSLNDLTLKNIRIDSNFMNYLEDTIKNIENLDLIGVKIEDNCMKRFYLFVSRIKLSSFRIRNSESALKLFNNKRFVNKFFRETKCANGGDLFIDSPPYITQECRFYPSKDSAVEYLTRCWCIVDLSLTIDPQWIPEIIEKRMKNWSENKFHMIIGMTEMPTEWNFSEYPNLELSLDGGAEFNEMHHSPSHLVVDNQTGKRISFASFIEGDVIGFRAIFSSIDVI